MEKRKYNSFLYKFSALNSQDHSEEIHWSSSCSSDYEDTSLNDKFSNQVYRTRVLKRKRTKKKKVPNNVSNLSITILDTSRDAKKVIRDEKSPILGVIARRRSNSKSPILKQTESFYNGNKVSSPILPTKIINLKSPILNSKTASPKLAIKVRKVLFNINKHEIDREHENIKQEPLSDITIKAEPEDKETDTIDRRVQLKEIYENLTQTENTSNAKLELVKRVKSFFESNFSSQNTSVSSQNSISEISTPKNNSKTSDEIEILTCKSLILPNTSNTCVELIEEISGNSSENSVYDFSKTLTKIRYKKDGHAYRLNKLLKKQKANLSLWQHERYMAANSNFIIPKGESTLLRIQDVNFKYGCHLIECVNVDDEKFLVLINSSYVLENIVCEMVLKVYEPYKILQYCNDCKLIINVTKFECSAIKS